MPISKDGRIYIVARIKKRKKRGNRNVERATQCYTDHFIILHT